MATSATGSSEVRQREGKGEQIEGSVTITVDAVAAAAESILTITDTNIEAGDVVMGCYSAAANSTGTAAIFDAYVSADSTLKIVLGNVHASAALTAESSVFYYTLRSDSSANRA